MSDKTAALLKRFEKLHPKLIDLSLSRMKRLLGALGNPHFSAPPVVHVAGTNGKGSTVAFLKAILEAASLRVHVFTSPHLRRFNERIVLAAPGGGRVIGDRALLDVLERAENANRGEPVTFFEITTAAAFLAFAETKADILLLETGLGGRLDATNVIDNPLAAVITPVSIDHRDFLGNTLSEIAGEKAGIIKAGSPVVVGPQEDEAFSVIEARAHLLGAPMMVAGRDFDAYEQQGRLVYQDEHGLLDLPLPRLFGRHQISNAGTAIATIRRLDGVNVRESDIAKGLTNVSWRARLERLGPSGHLYDFLPEGSEIWLDGGHNEAGARALAQALADMEERVPRPLHLIIGMLKTKDAAAFMHAFQGLAQFVSTLTIPGQVNAIPGEDLAEIAHDEKLLASHADTLEDALLASQAIADGPMRVVITGSLYLAGYVLEAHEGGDNAW